MHRFSHLQQSRPENGSRQILLARFVWRTGDSDVATCVVLLHLPVGLSLHVIAEEEKNMHHENQRVFERLLSRFIG